jgi:hypothetical protein
MINDKLHEAMVNFQYLEFMLRGALKKYEQLIRDLVNDYFEYPYDEEESAISNMSLVPLAKKFSKYINDKTFISKVEKINRARNRLAHAMFIKAEYLKDNAHKEIASEIDEIFEDSNLAVSLGDFVMQQSDHINFDIFAKKWIKIK